VKFVPSGVCFPPTALSSFSLSKKLAIARLRILILRSRAMKRVRTKSRLRPFSSGKLSWTFKEAYRFSTSVSRRLCVRSRDERAERAAAGASPCATAVRVEFRADSTASTSPWSVRTLSSSFFSRVGASVQVKLSYTYKEVRRYTHEIGGKAGPPVEVSIVCEGSQ